MLWEIPLSYFGMLFKDQAIDEVFAFVMNLPSITLIMVTTLKRSVIILVPMIYI